MGQTLGLCSAPCSPTPLKTKIPLINESVWGEGAGGIIDIYSMWLGNKAWPSLYFISTVTKKQNFEAAMAIIVHAHHCNNNMLLHLMWFDWISILCVRVIISKHSFKPFCVWILWFDCFQHITLNPATEILHSLCAQCSWSCVFKLFVVIQLSQTGSGMILHVVLTGTWMLAEVHSDILPGWCLLSEQGLGL